MLLSFYWLDGLSFYGAKDVALFNAVKLFYNVKFLKKKI